MGVQQDEVRPGGRRALQELSASGHGQHPVPLGLEYALQRLVQPLLGVRDEREWVAEERRLVDHAHPRGKAPRTRPGAESSVTNPRDDTRENPGGTGGEARVRV